MPKRKRNLETSIKLVTGVISIPVIYWYTNTYDHSSDLLIVCSLYSIMIATVYGVYNQIRFLLSTGKRTDVYFKHERISHVFYIPACLILEAPYNFIVSISLFSMILIEARKLSQKDLAKAINPWFTATYSGYLMASIISSLPVFPKINVGVNTSLFISGIGLIMIFSLVRRVLNGFKQINDTRIKLGQIKAEHDWNNDLFSLISHNLRTPLTSMKNALHILSKKNQDVKGNPKFKILNQELNKVVSIIEQATRSQKWFETQEIKLIDVLNDTLEKTSILKRSENCKRSHLESIVSSTEARAIALFLESAISNSVKYNSKITTVEIQSMKPHNRNELRIIVKDDGDGMNPLKLSRYGQAFSNSNDSQKGSGLGIYFIKGLVEQLGWTIDAKSLEGKGTTITLNLFLK